MLGPVVQALPPLVVESTHCRLPITERSTQALLEALVTAEPQALVEALKCDPTFVLWCCHHADRRDCQPIASVQAAAAWIIGGGLGRVIQDNVASLETAEPYPWLVDPTSVQRWAHLAAECILVAEWAAVHAPEQKADPEEAYLLGLLHKGQVWFELGARSPTAIENLMPLWLARQLTEVHAGPPIQSAAARSVAAAMQMLSGEASQETMVGFDRTHTGERRAALAHDWSDLQGGPRYWQELALKLAQLAQLSGQSDQRLEQEKLAALAEFAAGAGHEINNPIATISGRAQLLARDEQDPEKRRDLATIHAQAMRVHEMIADLMLFARPPVCQFAEVDAAAIVREVLVEVADRAAHQQVELLSTGELGPILLEADAVQLAVAFRAVIDNALEWMPQGGRLEVAVASGVGLPPGEAIFRFSDTGPGIPPSIRRHLFDPYFSGRTAGRGLGLGLSKCWRIATAHGGRVEIDSRTGSGATIEITLPIARSNALRAKNGQNGHGE